MNALLLYTIKLIIVGVILTTVACLQVNNFSETEQMLVLTTLATLALTKVGEEVIRNAVQTKETGK